MNTLLLVLCTLGCNLFLLGSASYIRQSAPAVDDKKTPEKLVEDVGKDQLPPNDRPYYVEQYSPEVARILMNPHLMQELYQAIQYQPQPSSQSGYEPAVEAPMKRAQTFVRFGKRAQTFVRFG